MKQELFVDNWDIPIKVHNNCYEEVVFTRNELASLAHSFYTCLKHQLMHQLYSLALPWMMLDPRLHI